MTQLLDGQARWRAQQWVDEQEAAQRVLDVVAPSAAYQRGRLDAYQDQCEGCPQASLGATTVPPDAHLVPRPPHWALKTAYEQPTAEAREAYLADYLRGYEAQARAQ